MTLKLALLNLKRNPRRSFALILTVAMGVSALFLFDGFNFGIMNQYRDNTIHFKTGHGQLNTKGYREQAFAKPWEHWLDVTPTLLDDLRKLPGVTHIFPRLDFYAVITNGDVTIAGRGTGVDGKEEADFFWNTSIVEGETLRDQKDGMILGIGLARALQAKPGTRLTLLTNTVHGSYNGIDVVVTGIFHSGIGEIDDGYFRIQRTEAARLLDTDKVETIAIGLTETAPWDKFAAAVSQKFPQLEATPFAVLDKVYYQHAVDWLGQQFLVIQIIIMVIVALSILNTFSFTVLERTEEIGNLRANGESAGEVMRLLLWEGAFIGLIGALVGILGSWLFNTLVIPHGILMPPAPGLTRQFFVRIELVPKMALVYTALGIGVVLFATFLAGMRRVRLSIAELLRHR